MQAASAIPERRGLLRSWRGQGHDRDRWEKKFDWSKRRFPGLAALGRATPIKTRSDKVESGCCSRSMTSPVLKSLGLYREERKPPDGAMSQGTAI